MAKTIVFQCGETVPIWAEVRTWAGVLYSPDQWVKLTLTDPVGDIATDDSGDIEDRAMPEDETGKFVFYYLSKVADTLGWWRARCKGMDGAVISKYVITDGGFRLEA